MKKYLFASSLFATILILQSVVMAHVSVEPKSIGIGSFTTFTISVLNEKEIPTTAVRIVLPDGLKEVSAYAKPGWQVTAKSTGNGDQAKVTELTWTDGSFGKDLRDEFKFSAQVPANPTALAWKTYQTYQDGSVVSWDQAPKEGADDSTGDAGPYAISEVVNDLVAKSNDSVKSSNDTYIIGAYVLSAVAILYSYLARRKK
jgi:uncharacterized protein YcnI